MLDSEVSDTAVPADVPSVRLSRSWNTTTVNQLLGLPGMFSTFKSNELKKLRIIAITASVASVIAAIIGLFYFAGIYRKRKVFRHYLIFFLIICDFLKAVVLMVYPIIILIRNDIYGIPAFYNTLGWLTAFAVEGADFAIAIFAVHFALLIFVPTWKWLNPKTGNMEGGLYPLRHILYIATFLLPMVLASLAFVNFTKFIPINLNDKVVLDNNNFGFKYQARVGGYKALSAWCYLPPRPYWYRLVLSWGPRYFIIILIFTIYVSIYLFVSKESRKIKNQIGDFRHSKSSLNMGAERNDSVLLDFRQKLILNVKLGLRKTGAMKVLQSLRSFFFLSFDDETEEETSDDYEDGSNDNPYSFSIDSMDYDDGYHSDDYRNGVQTFNYDPEKLSKMINENTPVQKQLDTLLQEDESMERNKNIKNLIRQSFDRSFRRPSFASKDSRSARSIQARTSNASSRAKSIADDPMNHFFSEDMGNSVFYHPSSSTSSSKKKRRCKPSHSQKERRSSVSRGRESHKSSKSSDTGSQRKDCGTVLSPVSSLVAVSGQLQESSKSRQDPRSSEAKNGSKEVDADADVGGVNPDHILDLKHNFQFETYQEFKKRRSQIRRQLRSIFIYPFSYIVIWTFPIVVDIIQYHYEIIHGPVIWLEYIATFMQPFSCVVDVSVFLYREKPWRHSWSIIFTKELISKFNLKGELGEKEILEMCNSKDGKRGWFYRGRWMKLECWRHKPQKWKRIAWFLHRTFKGFLANDYNYEDNCNDAEYWESYYSGKSPVSSSNRSTQGTQAFKDVINVDNRKGSSFSATTSENYSEIAGYVKVPIFWRFIHCLPMLGGIDLDELDRHLRQKNHDDPFVIPGLQIALNLDQVNEHRDANSFFKPDYRISSVPSKKAAVRPRLSESNRNSSASSHKNHSPSHSSANMAPVVSKFSFSANMDFSDIQNSQLPGISHENQRSSSNEMNLMDFLNH